MTPEPQTPVFAVTFGCSNCGNEWADSYPPKTTVKDSTTTKRAKAVNDDCDTLGLHNCECCHIVVCPVCERSDDVYVDEREPITEGDG